MNGKFEGGQHSVACLNIVSFDQMSCLVRIYKVMWKLWNLVHLFPTDTLIVCTHGRMTHSTIIIAVDRGISSSECIISTPTILYGLAFIAQLYCMCYEDVLTSRDRSNCIITDNCLHKNCVTDIGLKFFSCYSCYFGQKINIINPLHLFQIYKKPTIYILSQVYSRHRWFYRWWIFLIRSVK